MRKIKVLEVIDKTFLGGGQKNLLSLIENLDKEKFDVSVCSNPGGHLVDEVIKNSISHFPVSMSKRMSHKPIKDMRILLKENEFDIIHTHGGVAGFYGRWAARRFKKLAVVHTLHGLHYLYYRNIFLKYLYIGLEKIFSRFTNVVIFVSQADRNNGLKYKLASKEKIRLIENGIDFSSFEKRCSQEKHEDERRRSPVIGTVARLHRQKNISLLLKAGARIKKSYPGLKVLVVGDGPLRRKLEKLNKRLGTNDMIDFLGERKDIPCLISQMNIFVLPSLWEGLPYVLLEAAAMKMPVIGTDVDGIREMIQNEVTGILVSPKKPDPLAEALMRLLDNRKWGEELGLRFHKSVKEKYTISRMIHNIQDLYEELFYRTGELKSGFHE